MNSQFLTSPARAALIAVALASTSAMAQTVDVAAAPPPTATLPEAAPPPPVRTITETVSPEAMAQVRAEQAVKAKPAARAAVAPVRAAPVAVPIAPEAVTPVEAAPVAELPVAPTETVALPAQEARETVTVANDETSEDWLLYGGAAALALAGIGAAFAARRRKAINEGDSTPIKRNAMLEPTPQPRPMAPAAAPSFVEPGRTRIIEPVAPVAAPVASAAVVAATAKPTADPLFAKRGPLPEGVTDPLFTRRAEPLSPVTDPLFSFTPDIAPVTDPMFADREDYAGPGSKGSRAAAINRMRVADQGTAESKVRATDIEYV